MHHCWFFFFYFEQDTLLYIVPEESRSNARRTVIPAGKDATRALCAFVRGAIEPSSARLGAELEREARLLPRGTFDSAFFSFSIILTAKL